MRGGLRRLATPFETLADPFAPVERPSDRVWPFLRSLLVAMRCPILLALGLSVIAGGIEVFLIAYAGRLIDVLATADRATLWQVHGWHLIAVVLVLLVVRPVFHFAREATNDLGLRPNLDVMARWRAWAHVSRQSVGWFQDDLAGRTATRVMETGGAATVAIYRAVNTIVYVVIYVVGILILMAAADLRLAMPILLWTSLYICMTILVVPKMEATTERHQEARSALNGLMVDVFGNIGTVALFADSKAREREARTLFEGLRQRFYAVQRVEVGLNVAITVLEGVMLVGLVGYGVWLWQQGAATLGLVAAALALGFKITSMAEWLLDAVADIFASTGALREALKTVGQPLAITDAADARPLRVSGGAISLQGLHHRYGKERGGLDGVSLEIRAGEKVGLVGPSGAGKSTLANLILRFFELETGRIAIDGQDLRKVTQESLHANIAMVAQDSALLNRSLRDNITLGRDVSEEAIRRAARLAEAENFIPDLQDKAGRRGYDAHVGERGVKLSGGQRQRIAIARVILKDAPILILDEATSALDSEVEAAIQKTLFRLMEGKTVLAIAHRLSTIAAMDRIVVMEAGRIVEQGTHDALLAAGGLYARLWARQSGGFIGAEDGQA
ncbi:ATP-binding cassette domain-containing protein [Algicella marina]|uniref:ATP-binding cassette domain-containing protein n=2 Tax=Algicella marina TaxID=2683284 RepID=A0A6P1T6P7_9RHOB|nr:ATP-binding cassette domain-containing protein [Algicella marina]